MTGTSRTVRTDLMICGFNLWCMGAIRVFLLMDPPKIRMKEADIGLDEIKTRALRDWALFDKRFHQSDFVAKTVLLGSLEHVPCQTSRSAATHKHPVVQRWLKAHRRFHLHFTPTSSSWLNLVERFFGELRSMGFGLITGRPERRTSADILRG